MKTTAIAPWYGSNRLLAHKVGELLAGCSWVGVPFAGGMCELAHIAARTMVVNDRHRHVINLARVVAGDRERLQRHLDDLLFHPDVLADAQKRCLLVERYDKRPQDADEALYMAADYFVCAWMGRNGTAGTDREFAGGLSVRWDAGGGDSAVRFRSAVESLAAWQPVLRRCTFSTLGAPCFLDKVQDTAGHGVYCDPPFPGAGDDYRHKFTEQDQRLLAHKLGLFRACRVVVRYYDHPLIRELYPEDRWAWHRPEGGRTQANKAAPEVLLVNRVGGA